MKKSQEKSSGLSEMGFGLPDLIHRGARQIIRQVIEAELGQMLEEYENVKTLSGQRAVARNGYLPEREVLTAVGPVTVHVPKVRDLKGISTGDMSEELKVRAGDDAKGVIRQRGESAQGTVE